MLFLSFDGCAAWLHDAPGSRGVVVVPAHGFEDLCSRHALRVLADRLADAGLPTLRLDLHGTADSAGSDADPGRVEAWLDNIQAAVACLRERTEVTEVALVGLRLGALLSLSAAPHLDLARLVLIAPPPSGAAYVREHGILAQVLGSAGPDAGDGSSSVAGFRIAADTIAALKGLEPLKGAGHGVSDVLIMAPDNGRSAPKLGAHLREAGAAVTEEVFAGYQNMMADPTASALPGPALDRIVDWLAAGLPAPSRPRSPAPVRHVASTLRGPGWTEEGVIFGPDGAGAGILCRPTGANGREPAAIFLNAGGIYHVGWARMYVDMARRLAGAGVTTLRIDLPGIGDAAPWPGPGRMTFYDPATASVTAALDLLTNLGVGPITLVGGCSGAHHAFHAAVADGRVSGLVLLNVLCFVWGPSYALPLNAWRMSKPREVASRTRAAEEAGSGTTTAIARLMDRALPVLKGAARGLFEGAKTLAGPLRNVLGAGAAANEVEAAFRLLSTRGTKVRLVYSADDPGRTELERYMGPDGARATALSDIDMHLLPDADHALTPMRARHEFEQLVADLVTATAPPAPERPVVLSNRLVNA